MLLLAATCSPDAPRSRAAITASARSETEPGPVVIVPLETHEGVLPDGPGTRLPATGSAMHHATRVGWSGDGTHVGLCGALDGSPCWQCRLFDRAGAPVPTKLGECPDAAAVEKLWTDGGFTAGANWAHGAALRVAWEVMPVKTGGKVLAVGGQGPDDAKLIDVVRIASSFDLEPGAAAPRLDDGVELHPEGIVFAPDGSHLAVFAHEFIRGEDRFSQVIVPAKQFAFDSYNQRGERALMYLQFREALELFERAAAVDHTRWEAAFNLARVHARLGDPGAEADFARAIELGGDAPRQRARGNYDLAAVRDTAWFKAAVPAAD